MNFDQCFSTSLQMVTKCPVVAQSPQAVDEIRLASHPSSSRTAGSNGHDDTLNGFASIVCLFLALTDEEIEVQHSSKIKT